MRVLVVYTKFLGESGEFIFDIDGEYGLSFILSKSAIVIRLGDYN